MDGTQDSLAVPGELFHEVADGPRGLTVETGGRFIKKEEEFGTGGEFNTDGQTLAFCD
jgi:hypothetical protein